MTAWTTSSGCAALGGPARSGWLSDARVREIVAEARAHAAESGRTLEEEFGPPDEYAAVRPDARRRTTLTIAFYAVLVVLQLVQMVDGFSWATAAVVLCFGWLTWNEHRHYDRLRSGAQVARSSRACSATSSDPGPVLGTPESTSSVSTVSPTVALPPGSASSARWRSSSLTRSPAAGKADSSGCVGVGVRWLVAAHASTVRRRAPTTARPQGWRDRPGAGRARCRTPAATMAG